MASLKELPSYVKRFPVFTVFMVYVFFTTGIVVAALCLLVQPLWLINKSLYRKVVTQLVFFLFGEMVWVCIDWADVQVTLFGEERIYDQEIHKQFNLMTLSHRGDFDWLIGLVFCYYSNFLQTMRTLPKKSVKYIPGFGQLLWAMECPFLSRSYQRDEVNIQKGLKAFAEYPYPVQVTIFCEGTRFTEEKFKESVEYAKKNGIQPLKHHLLPRTKGYAILVNSLRQYPNFKVTYDAGFAYPAGQEYLNGKQFTLRDILAGSTVKVFFYVRSIPLSDLPETMDDLQNFCHQLYVHKDNAYQYFVENGTYPNPSKPMVFTKRQIWILRLNILLWLFVTSVCPSLWLLKMISANAAWLGLVLAVCIISLIATVGLFTYARTSQKKKRS
ncbi:PREDICTED: 1-acyl-sn-glycerol-3-phosphate acyltransferase delta-like [Amphimedon queenslandica]|uniref:Phospholipid/glycerol acyltransferase domain-containing protein n=1 Tax=Amphimedon queenslandica TaxID=400682 RepID=A0A1X7UX50_AMPQE|nr:PREDICTED: 1-acyl-sn-glycerol-3-phosphate acyltransferase delta-like [Amphimedon queenslandica]|eukprot:XP_019851690.1 PREDICTED: 1-acyl-sn-glycerol-3-phosphate acyltransferase delta-like [Amphimedon queenslandica]